MCIYTYIYIYIYTHAYLFFTHPRILRPTLLRSLDPFLRLFIHLSSLSLPLFFPLSSYLSSLFHSLSLSLSLSLSIRRTCGAHDTRFYGLPLAIPMSLAHACAATVSSRDFNSQHFRLRVSNPRTIVLISHSKTPGPGAIFPDWTLEN